MNEELDEFFSEQEYYQQTGDWDIYWIEQDKLEKEHYEEV